MSNCIITLDDSVQNIEIYSSFIPSEQLAYYSFIERCNNDGSVDENKTCIINDYINNY